MLNTQWFLIAFSLLERFTTSYIFLSLSDFSSSKQDLSHFFWILASNLAASPRFLEIEQDSITYYAKIKQIFSTLPSFAKCTK